MRKHKFFQPRVVMEFTDEEIRLVCIPTGISNMLHRLTGVNCDRIALPAGVIDQGNLRQPQIFTQTIRAYFHRKGWGSTVAVFITVPLHQALMRHFVLPWMPKRWRHKALSYLVEEEVPIPAKDLVYNYAVVGENRSQNILRVLVGAARSSVVRRYVQAMQQAGASVKGVGFAVASFGDALGLNGQEDTLYLSSFGNADLLVLFRGNTPEIIRTFASSQLNEPSREEATREIEHLLMYYGTRYPASVIRKVLSSGVWAGDLASGLGQSGMVTETEPVRLPGVSSAFQALASENRDFTLLIGYAYAIMHRRDLLRIRPATQPDTNWRRLASVVLALAMCSMVAGFAFWYPWREQEHRLQIEVVQMREQGRRTETLLRERQDLTVGWKQAVSHSFTVGDSLIGLESVSIPGLVLKSIEYKDGGLFVRGQAEQGAQIQQMMTELRALGWNRPNLTSYQQSEDKIAFALNAQAKH